MAFLISFIFLILVSFASVADGACEDYFFNSRVEKIKLTNPFKPSWWQIGNFNINSKDLASQLENQTTAFFNRGKIEGGSICFKVKNTYITIGDHGYGGAAILSYKAPKCISCASDNSLFQRYYKTGIGLYLGDNKKKVEGFFRSTIKSDEVSVTYSTVNTKSNVKVFNDQTIHFKFVDSKLNELMIANFNEYEHF